MTKTEKDVIYGKICKLLTDYEIPNDDDEKVTIDGFYNLMIEIQTSWEELTNN